MPERFPDHHRALVAFSGGIDSTALLLAACETLRPRWPLKAVHVHHGLSDAADDWAAHCARVCEQLEVPLEVIAVQVDVASSGPEGAARAARYQALAARVAADSLLLTGHHARDQVESMLIQLLRGAGPRGLAGMGEIAAIGDGLLVRPFLQVDRDRLCERVRHAGVAVIEDPMNRDLRLPRGFVRHQLLPLIEQHRPGAQAALARSAALCAQLTAAVDSTVDAALTRVCGLDPGVLHLDRLAEEPQSCQREILRSWLRRLGLAIPQQQQLEELLRQATSRADAQPCVSWPGVEVRRYRKLLFASPPLVFPDPDRVLFLDQATLALPGIGTLQWIGPVVPGLSVRFRRGGEQLRPQGSKHTHTLKQLCQDAGVPPWERQRLPLVYRGDELLAVADLWWTQDYRRLLDEAGSQLLFRRELPAAAVVDAPRPIR